MTEPRSPKNEELTEVIDFLNQHLRGQSQWSIQTEYPLAFSLSNSHNIKIIKDEGTSKILSHAVFKVHILKTPVGIFKVAVIGSVVTDPQYRQKGLSQTILKHCVDSARKHGCDFALLWSDLFDFYRKLDFELAGSELSFNINKSMHLPETQLKFINSSQISPEALLQLYTRHTVGTVRTPRELELYLKIPNSRVYTAWSPQNKLMAYAVEGKGADLQNYIHEWGGDVPDLLQLIQHIYNTNPKDLTLITPSHSQNLIRHLQGQGFSQHYGFLGMIKILIPENLVTKINRYALQKGLSKFKMNYANGMYSWSTNERVYSTDSDKEMVSLIFGPRKAGELFKFDPDTNQVLEDLFPIPFWMWGWDSI